MHECGAELHVYACTLTLHVLSDGIDVYLRCQPIVKGTIRFGHIGQAGPLLVFLPLSVFLSFVIFFVACIEMC